MALQPTLIVATALNLLDETGLDGLTMRKLADALGVQAPSLYWHFPGKPALLDGMAEALLDGIGERIDRSGDHLSVLRSAVYALRAALLARRDGARVYAGTFVVGDNVLTLADILIGSLMAAAFDAGAASRISFTLIYYVLGFVIEEQALDRRNGVLDLASLQQRLEAQTQGKYAHVRKALPHLMDVDQDARFAFGVDLILAGLTTAIQPTDNVQRLINAFSKLK